MGLYFDPVNDSFLHDSRDPLYVDKTGLLEILNQALFSSCRCIALSHARRFGKSQAAGMIDAYYNCRKDSRELFEGFEIAAEADFEEHLNRYHVIHIDVSSVADFHKEDLTDTIQRTLREEFANEISGDLHLNRSLPGLLYEIYHMTGRAFVIILDEWDCVIRNHADRPDLVHTYLQFLHGLFKSEESKSFLALAYITGILPIKKIQDESALNNFAEYTMLSSKKLTRYFGFTEEEVRALCDHYQMDFSAVQNWYDGYQISGLHMYNPNSVYRAMREGSLEAYWRNTSAFETINSYITRNYHGLKEDILTMLAGGQIPVDTETFQNDLSGIESRDEVLTALIHLGYLAYQEKTGKAYIPNFEVAKAYQSALKKSGWTEVEKSISACDELLEAAIKGDAAKVAELIEEAQEAYTSVLRYHDENSLSCVLTMAFFTAPAYYTIIRELPSGKGFADLVFLPRPDCEDKPAMVIELKYLQDADSAIRQIKERRYTGALKGYAGKLLLVGISYGRDKKHDCRIEAWKNE